MHINHLLNDLSTRARNAVRKAIAEIHFHSCNTRTITTIEEFVELIPKRYLSSFSNCGKKSVSEIERRLRDMGYVLREK